MEHDSDYKIPLEDLLSVLRNNGYELSIEQVLEIQSALLTADIANASLHDLKFILAPIIAKSDEEQHELYHVIDAYLLDQRRQHEEEPDLWHRLSRKLRYRIRLGTLIAFIFAGVYMFMQNSRTSFDKNIKVKVQDRTITAGPKKDSSAFVFDSMAALRSTIPIQPYTEPLEISLTATSGPFEPRPVDFNLQVSLSLGILLGVILAYFTFYEKRKLMEMQKGRKPETIDAGNKHKDELISTYNKPWDAQHERLTLEFPEKDFLIRKGPEFTSIKNNLRKPAFNEYANLHLQKSIMQTARNAGFTSLVYDDEWKERKYLVWFDDSNADSHLTSLMNYFVNYLKTSRIPLKKFNSHANLQELSLSFSDHHLVIIGSFNAQQLNGWASRSVITPTPIADWTDNEKELQKNGFNVVPADIEAIKVLSRAIIENEQVTIEKLAKQVKEFYSAANFNLNTVTGLRAYLNNEILFQAVCSLAVYPRLSWPLTLALFSANTDVVPDYNTLLKICRIPWLQNNVLDPQLRFALLGALVEHREIIARKTIIEMLKEVEATTIHNSPAFKELETQYAVNTFFLYAHDPEKYHNYAKSKETITEYWKDLNEQALKDHIDQRQGGLLPVNKEGTHVTVEEFLLKESQFEKRNVTLSKLALLTVPAILLYIILSIWKPEQVYPTNLYKIAGPVTIVINKDDNCKQKLVKVDASTESFSHTLNTSKQTDTIVLSEVPYNQQIGITFYAEDGLNSFTKINARDSMLVFSAKCRE